MARNWAVVNGDSDRHKALVQDNVEAILPLLSILDNPLLEMIKNLPNIEQFVEGIDYFEHMEPYLSDLSSIPDADFCKLVKFFSNIERAQ